MQQPKNLQRRVLLLIGLILVLVLTACVPVEQGMDHADQMHGDNETPMQHDGAMTLPATVAVAGEATFPESIAIHENMAYVSAFFSGEIQQIDLLNGESTTLVAAGDDGVVMGWGLWYDDANDLLLACANRNPMGPQTNPNAARAIDPASGEIVETWELPAGAMCNSILTNGDGNIYISDVSPAASIIMIDRASGAVMTWLDDPTWENDSGFGVGGLVWDGADSLYASATGPLYRVPINADGTAGEPILQTILDGDGNQLPALGFDGFVFAGEQTMYGAAFDFDAFQSQLVKVVAVGDETVQTEVIFTDAIGITGVDVADGQIFAADGQIVQALFLDNYAAAPFQIHVIDPKGAMATQQMAYSGPVTEMAIRRLNVGQDVEEFATARDAFIELLRAHPGATVDREFAPFVDFLTFAPPEPPVFVGMTEYEDLAAFEAAGGLFEGPEAQAFIATFQPEVFAVMRPLNPADRYDLATVATEPGQVLEIAVRDLASYTDLDMADYEAKRDAFLAALAQQPGWVTEMQWVSLLDPNLVVGMTVYESVEAYQAIYGSEFGQSQVVQDFGGGYPLVAGYAAFDARTATDSAEANSTVESTDEVMSDEVLTLDSGATVHVYRMGDVTIHGYTGGPAANGTHIIESANSLVLVDAQFAAPVAQEFRAYADSLGKPIERLIVTHEHPDHWFGLGAAFGDVPLYTTTGTQAFLAAAGADMLQARGESMGADPTYVPIENVLPDGGETIDGVTYEYRVYQHAEAEEQVVILLPNQGAILTGDLIYNNFYLILEPGFDNWIAILEELQSLDGYDIVLPGHGQPDGMGVLTENIDYLETAKALFAEADGPEAFQAAMLEQYPDLNGAFFWDLILSRLYPPVSE